MFDAIVQEKLGYYVYCLRKPTGEIFYVGKGVKNRCFDHVEEARKNLKSTPKLNEIRGILSKNKSVRIDIIRHGISVPKTEENTALLVEAAIIDVLDLVQGGTNLVRGHGTEYGIESANELQIKYGATELRSEEPLLLIKINNSYNKGMSLQQVYEATRWAWNLRIPRAQKCNYVLGVADGIVRGVFKPLEFLKVPEEKIRSPKDIGRVYFEGDIVEDSPYLHTSTKTFQQRGAQKPERYLNA